MVRLYYIPTCHHCIDARKFLNQQGIEFEEINITKDREGLARMKNLTQQMGVPVIEVGEKILIGFDRKKLETALNSRQN